jgi:hypothetical protein
VIFLAPVLGKGVQPRGPGNHKYIGKKVAQTSVCVVLTIGRAKTQRLKPVRHNRPSTGILK